MRPTMLTPRRTLSPGLPRPCSGTLTPGPVAKRKPRGKGTTMIRLLSLLAALLLAFPAATQTRHALVIGIDEYAHVPPLQKARNDARALAAALDPAGFEVTTLLDPDRSEMIRALRRFAASLDEGDEALFYFAGHGVELDGQNYLLPADILDASPGDEEFLIADAIGVELVVSSLEQRGVRVSLLILDACRDSPFPPRGTRSVGATRGLGRIEPPQGSFVLFSAGAGQAALDRLGDDDADPNSVFTRALLPRLAVPGLELNDIVREVRSDVRRIALTAGHDQHPAFYGEMQGSFHFIPPVLAPPTRPVATTAGAPIQDPCAAALPVWTAIQDSGSDAALEGFMQDYPGCSTLVALARQRLEAALAEPAPLSAEGSIAQATCERLADRGQVTFERLQGYASQAVTTCREALAEDPGHAPTLTRLARALTAAEDYDEARALFERAAAMGDAVAMNGLGYLYQNGRGVAPDDDAALRWYRAAVEAGDLPAAANVGWMYETGRGMARPDHAEAVRWYRLAAEAGHARAQVNLGWMYANGRGVDLDDAAAVHWYRLGAENGYARGMYLMGQMTRTGRGVLQDAEAAVGWYRAAAEQNHTWAIWQLGTAYQTGEGVPEVDHAQARALYQRGVELGHPDSMVTLGWMIERGLGTDQADLAEAVRLYRAAADLGNTAGMANLGSMYARGLGVAQDEAEAVRWYRLAADQGDAWAQTRLGWMYENGRGVAQNDSEAVRWYRAAAEAGDADAMRLLADHYRDGLGIAQDEAEAVRWYRAAAEAGNALGMRRLGIAYQSGRGIPQDDSEAALWYRRAADAGDDWGMLNLGLLLESGNDIEEAMHWYRAAAEAGNARAMRQLGEFYSTGAHLPKNISEAIRWLRIAADAGDTQAMFELGDLLAGDAAGAADISEVIGWFTAAAEAGDETAMALLGDYHASLAGDDADHARAAVRWFRASAEAGDRDAQFDLGSLLLDGPTVIRDRAEGVRAIRAAAEAGHERAMGDLGRRLAIGDGVRQDEREAARWLLLAERAGNTMFSYNLGRDAWDLAMLRAVQTILRDEGFYQGAIDGRFGPQSRAALERYLAAGR